MMIEANNLSKRFGRHHALENLNLSVREGSAYALIGPNGAGKTTAIKVLMNIMEPTGGSATVMGTDSRAITHTDLAHIGYVSENQELPQRLTVGEFIAFLRPFYPTWDRTLEAEILAQMRLPTDRKIRDLSHGMRMKLTLASALPFRPTLLILDEPFSGMDPLVRDELMESLARQAGETTIFISSHELSEIEGFVTDIGYLDEGALLFQESMSDLSARVREVHVTLDQAAVAPPRVPEDWLNLQTAGNVVSFVDMQYSEDALAANLASAFRNIVRVEAQPVALRAIFTTLARTLRDKAATKRQST